MRENPKHQDKLVAFLGHELDQIGHDLVPCHLQPEASRSNVFCDLPKRKPKPLQRLLEGFDNLPVTALRRPLPATVKPARSLTQQPNLGYS